MTPKQIKEKLAALNGEIEALGKSLSEAKTPEEKAEAEKKITAKEAEFAEVEGMLSRAKAKSIRDSVIADADSLASTVLPAPGNIGGVSEGAVPAEAIDWKERNRAHEKAFGEVMASKGKALGKMGSRVIELLTPSNARLEGKGVLAPASLRAAIFGKEFVEESDRIGGKDITSAADGVLIAPDHRAGQILELPPEPAFLVDRVTKVPVKGGTVSWPRLVQTDPPSGNEFGGVIYTAIREGEEKPKTEPEWEEVEIKTYEHAGRIDVNDRMFKRAEIDLMAYLRRLLVDSAKGVMDFLIIQGNGINQALGITIDPAVRTTPRTIVNQVVYQDLVHLRHLILPHHRAPASFVCGDDVEQHLELQLDAFNRPLFTASTASGPYDRLVGKPYTVTLRTPALGQAGDIIIGDWPKYFLAVESDVMVEASPHPLWTQNKTVIKAYFLVGGRAVLPRAFGYLDDATS